MHLMDIKSISGLTPEQIFQVFMQQDTEGNYMKNIGRSVNGYLITGLTYRYFNDVGVCVPMYTIQCNKCGNQGLVLAHFHIDEKHFNPSLGCKCRIHDNVRNSFKNLESKRRSYYTGLNTDDNHVGHLTVVDIIERYNKKICDTELCYIVTCECQKYLSNDRHFRFNAISAENFHIHKTNATAANQQMACNVPSTATSTGCIYSYGSSMKPARTKRKSYKSTLSNRYYIGKQFGNWVVVDIKGKDKYGYVRWEVECTICGQHHIQNANYIVSEKRPYNCGCGINQKANVLNAISSYCFAEGLTYSIEPITYHNFSDCECYVDSKLDIPILYEQKYDMQLFDKNTMNLLAVILIDGYEVLKSEELADYVYSIKGMSQVIRSVKAKLLNKPPAHVLKIAPSYNIANIYRTLEHYIKTFQSTGLGILSYSNKFRDTIPQQNTTTDSQSNVIPDELLQNALILDEIEVFPEEPGLLLKSSDAVVL